MTKDEMEIEKLRLEIRLLEAQRITLWRAIVLGVLGTISGLGVPLVAAFWLFYIFG